MLLLLGNLQVTKVFQLAFVLVGAHRGSLIMLDIVVHCYGPAISVFLAGDVQSNGLRELIPGRIVVKLRAVGCKAVVAVGSKPFGYFMKHWLDLLLALKHLIYIYQTIKRSKSVRLRHEDRC